MQNDSTFFKYAGIYNLGLIQESLPLKQINEHDNSQIWHTMISNIDPNNCSLYSLYNSNNNKFEKVTSK